MKRGDADDTDSHTPWPKYATRYDRTRQRRLRCPHHRRGAFGAAAARDAALRGLRTALIERADFGGSDLRRVLQDGPRRHSLPAARRRAATARVVPERSALLRIAPHLVQPLPIAIPTYGHGRRAARFLATGATRLRPAHAGSQQRASATAATHPHAVAALALAPARTVSASARRPDLSGAVVFEDGQMYNPARLVLAFVRSAVDGRRDCMQLRRGDEFPVAATRSRRTGARSVDRRGVRRTRASHAERRRPLGGLPAERLAAIRRLARLPFSRDAYFIVDRAPTSDYGVAVQGLSRDKDALLGRATRHLFAVPVARQDAAWRVAHDCFRPRQTTRRSSPTRSSAGSTS